MSEISAYHVPIPNLMISRATLRRTGFFVCRPEPGAPDGPHHLQHAVGHITRPRVHVGFPGSTAPVRISE